MSLREAGKDECESKRNLGNGLAKVQFLALNIPSHNCLHFRVMYTRGGQRAS